MARANTTIKTNAQAAIAHLARRHGKFLNCGGSVTDLDLCRWAIKRIARATGRDGEAIAAEAAELWRCLEAE